MKPSKKRFEAAVRECLDAGCDLERPWWLLSAKAKKAWIKHQRTIIDYIGRPTRKQTELAMKRVKDTFASFKLN